MPSSLTEGLPSTLVCSTCPPVSVCGTGAPILASGFSRPSGLRASGLAMPAAPSTPRLGLTRRICLPGAPTRLEGRSRPPPLAPGVPASLNRTGAGRDSCTRCPSPTPCGLGLGPPHPQLISIAAEPSGIRWGGFTPPSRYSCRHSHSSPLQPAFQRTFSADDDAPLPWLIAIRGVGARLEPRWIVGAAAPRPVSYYALFQGWLLLSQPPGCLGATTPLPTEPGLGGLSWRSGLFPSRRWNLAPTVSLQCLPPRTSAFGSGR